MRRCGCWKTMHAFELESERASSRLTEVSLSKRKKWTPASSKCSGRLNLFRLIVLILTLCRVSPMILNEHRTRKHNNQPIESVLIPAANHCALPSCCELPDRSVET